MEAMVGVGTVVLRVLVLVLSVVVLLVLEVLTMVTALHVETTPTPAQALAHLATRRTAHPPRRPALRTLGGTTGLAGHSREGAVVMAVRLTPSTTTGTALGEEFRAPLVPQLPALPSPLRPLIPAARAACMPLEPVHPP